MKKFWPKLLAIEHGCLFATSAALVVSMEVLSGVPIHLRLDILELTPAPITTCRLHPVILAVATRRRPGNNISAGIS